MNICAAARYFVEGWIWRRPSWPEGLGCKVKDGELVYCSTRGLVERGRGFGKGRKAKFGSKVEISLEMIFAEDWEVVKKMEAGEG